MRLRLLGAIVLTVTVIGCGSSPTAPTSAAPLSGTWESTTTSSAPNTCTNFVWIVSTSGDTGDGPFTATCNGSVLMVGTATATRMGNSFTWTATGEGPLAGGLPCAFTLNATITIDGKNRLDVPCTGTTCVGAVSGSELLHQ